MRGVIHVRGDVTDALTRIGVDNHHAKSAKKKGYDSLVDDCAALPRSIAQRSFTSGNFRADDFLTRSTSTSVFRLCQLGYPYLSDMERASRSRIRRSTISTVIVASATMGFSVSVVPSLATSKAARTRTRMTQSGYRAV